MSSHERLCSRCGVVVPPKRLDRGWKTCSSECANANSSLGVTAEIARLTYATKRHERINRKRAEDGGRLYDAIRSVEEVREFFEDDEDDEENRWA